VATIPLSHHDLLRSQVAILATIGADARPQLSAVWFLADEDGVGLSLNTARRKVKNLLANPVCTLFILDLTNPARYLEIRGDAEIQPDEVYTFADRVGAKYGADLRTMDAPGELRVRVRIKPARINAVDMSR
jgi:PPOX class probable F420-dependent enzyme